MSSATRSKKKRDADFLEINFHIGNMRRAVTKKTMRMLSVRQRSTARQQVAAAKRAAHIGAYREVTELANLAVRGLQLGPGELKARDTASGAFAGADWNGVAVLLNGIARGDDIDERVGRQILIRSYELSVIWHQAAPGAHPSRVARLVVVYDKQTNAAALTPAQVLTAVGTINAATSPKNLENRDRFTILRDIRTPMAAAETTDYEPPPKALKVYQSITLPVTFNAGDAGTVADITTGSLYAIFISDQGAVLPSFSYTCRVRYEDK